MVQKKLLKKGLVGAVALSTLLCLANPSSVDAASWKKNHVGWWYQEDNGSWASNTWRKVNGSWYWFDQNGYMATGWRLIGGKWYYLQPSGAMLEKGWHWIGDKCYYMYDSGAMASNTWIGSYYVDGSGKWVPGKTKAQAGWVQSGKRWWYRHADGSYTKNGWEKINGQWYYFDNAGWMVANQWIGDYYVTSNGAMATNTWIGNYYVDGSGKWVPDAQKNQHKHTWVVKQHLEEGHYENGDLIKPEEGHNEIIHHEAEYKDVWVVDKEAWTETVNHPEQGHYETVVDKPAWEEWVDKCHKCDFIYTDAESWKQHVLSTGHTSYGDFCIKHPAETHEEWVVDKEAWTETVNHPEEGHTEKELVKEAWDEEKWVVDKPAVYEKVWVVDKEGWTETFCISCGKKK